MNIFNIQEKYFHVKSVTCIHDKNGYRPEWRGNLFDVMSIEKPNDYTSIIITDAPDHPSGDILLIVYDLMCLLNNGNRVFLDDIDKDIMDDLFQKLSERKPKNDDDHVGISLQHIEGVGYILTALRQGNFIVRNEYTLEEYEKRMGEYSVCAIAKQEKDYIRDWVKYQYHIGFDRIYLLDNNTDENERYSEMFKEDIEAGRMDVIDVRGNQGCQIVSYAMVYYNNAFKHLAVVDIDEFIWMDERSKYTNIKEFLDDVDKSESPHFGVMLQWRCYGGTGKADTIDVPIWEANIKQLEPTMRKNARPECINGWSKSIYKQGFSIEFNEHFGWETGPNGENWDLKFIGCDGKPISRSSMMYNIEGQKNLDVYVKHFIFRDIKNVYYNKYLRGHAGFGKGSRIGDDGWNWWQWYHNMNYYTDVVPVLTEDEQIFMRSRGMKVNYTFHPNVIVINNEVGGNTNINRCTNEILVNLMGAANVELVTCTALNPYNITQPNYCKNFNLRDEEYDFDFLTKYTSTDKMCGHNMYNEPWLVSDPYQEPIVISIGFPLDYIVGEVPMEKQQDYIGAMRGMMNVDHLRQFMRDIIEHPDLMVVPSMGVVESPNAVGWGESLDEWLPTVGLQRPQYGLNNNTFITSLSNYLKLKEFQKTFLEHYGAPTNKYIIDNIRGNYTTMYHAYVYSYLSIFNNILFVRPA